MMSNVKKKDVPLISISLVAILFIAAALSLFPQQSADAANAIYTFVTRTLGFRRTGIGFAGNGTGDLFSHQ
ncbi:putative quarternary ammonium transport protein (fragment) [Escherichia coli]|uniref:Putative quarternary ammonium transport protein n=1 Tax=Escherichia coli TaxID=562 RepID=A0A376U8Q8_ECOLX